MIHSTPRRYGEHRKTEIDNSSPAVGGITNAPNTNKSSGQNRISLKNRQKPLSIAMEVDNKQLRLETYVKLFFFFFFFWKKIWSDYVSNLSENNLEEDSQLNHSSPFKELNCRKRQFWIQLWRYLKEAWTGVISGTGITNRIWGYSSGI